MLTMNRASDILTTLDRMVCEIARLIGLEIDNCVIVGGLGAGDSHLALIEPWIIFLNTSAAHDVSITEFDIWSILAPTSTLAATLTPTISSPLRCSVDNLWLAVGMIRICDEGIVVTLNLQIYLVNVFLAI